MAKGNLISLLYHLKDPGVHLVLFPGPPEEGQSRTYLNVLRAGHFRIERPERTELSYFALFLWQIGPFC